MPLWEVQGRPGRVYSEALLVRRIGRGKILPDDAVRPVGDQAWRVAREVVTLQGPLAGAHRVHRWQLFQGLLWHVATFAGVSYFAHLPPIAVMGWGIGVAAHAFGTVGRLIFTSPRRLASAEARSALGASTAEARAPQAQPDLHPAPPGTGAAGGDPFLAELSAVLDDLDRVARERALPGSVDLAALRTAAQDLRRRHLEMARLGDVATRERLGRERDEALAQAAAARDPRTVEVFRDQARSVSERLDAMREAAEAAARLEARERTLLHQVESLRLGVLRSGADEDRAPELAGEARRLQVALKAEAEIDNALAAARLRAARLPEGG